MITSLLNTYLAALLLLVAQKEVAILQAEITL